MNVQKIQDLYGAALTAQKNGDLNKALRALDNLLIEEPTFTPGWATRAGLLEAEGVPFDAILNYDRAINLSPNTAGYHSNRGVSYLSLGKYHRALDNFERALELDPTITETWSNKGNTYRRLLMIETAANCYREAIKLNPDYANAHLGLGMCQLELMKFEEGWKEFKWRFHTDQMPPRGLPQPEWKGEWCDDNNKALLIYEEQGFGDTLQFMRYVKHAKAVWGGLVYVEARLSMYRILKDLEGVDAVIVFGEQIPSNVVRQVALMDVPAIVGTEKGFEGAYLKADPQLIDYWQTRLKILPKGLRIGICWAGQNRETNPTASAIDARRSLSLSAFADAARTQGVIWVSLQKGGPASQIKAPPIGMILADFTSDFQDFADTAACIQNLDLVITVDTAVAHLAAATGKPTWMLSRYDGCWRWFGKRGDSPWYPSLTQFRQPTEGDWDPVLEAVWRQLQRFVVDRQVKAA